MTLRRLARSIPLVLLAALGCQVGTRLKKFAPAQGPAGVATQILLVEVRTRITGELLAVGDSALFVLRNGQRVVAVSYAAIERAEFRQIGMWTSGGQPPDSALAQRLALVSRFPQGMSGDLLARVLAVHAQSDLDRVERR